LRILFIAGQAIKSNSSVTMMNLSYINGLVELGYEVNVITSKFPNEHIAVDTGFKLPKGVIINEYALSSTFNLMSSKQKKKSLKHQAFSIFKSLAREVYYKLSIYNSQKGWINNIEKVELNNEFYDYIISSSDPKHSHLFAEKLIESNKVRYGSWIQLWGDPMYQDITRKGLLLKKRLFKEEERLISLGDKVIYVSPFTALEQKKLFPKYEEKMDYVLIPFFKRDESLPKRTRGVNLVFGYYGDYNTNIRNLEPLYNAALESKIQLFIRGNSNKVLSSTKSINVENRVTINELEKLEKNTDVFVHLCNSQGNQIPAKVYYYSGTKKPILFILDGESEKIKNYFQKYDRYIFCNNNKEDILKAINKIHSAEYSPQETRIVEELSPAFIAKDLIEKIEVKSND
jgi:hypothetical protein